MPARNLRNALISPALAAAVVMAACAVAGCASTSPTVVKIGFVAPFEGRYREIGDEVIPAARLAVREYAGRYPNNQIVIELVAYDDQGVAAQAEAQAKKLVADPSVAVVIGHWRDGTTAAALPVYQQAGIPLITYSPLDLGSGEDTLNLSPSEAELRQLAEEWGEGQTPPTRLIFAADDDPLSVADMLHSSGVEAPAKSIVGGPVWGLRQFYALAGDAQADFYFVTGSAYPADLPSGYWLDDRVTAFVEGFEAGSLGAPPGMRSVIAYEVTWLAIRRAADRAGVSLSSSVDEDIRFDANGRRIDAPVYVYRWEDGQPRLIQVLRPRR